MDKITKDDVLKRASEVFGSNEKAMLWLTSANLALGGVIPMSLMDSEVGTQKVMDALGRIENGIFM